MPPLLRYLLPLSLFSIGCQLILRPDPNLFVENTRPRCQDRVDNDGDARTDCDDSECTALCLCGNLLLDEGEACDDGNNDNNDGCDEACALEEVSSCGDGVADADEECDDEDLNNKDCVALGFTEGLLGCSPNCTFDDSGCSVSPLCGNGIVDANEECDFGPLNSNDAPDGCRLTCRLAFCGDLVLDANEECDDGGNANNDGCNTDCQPEFCGDSVINNVSEECDDSNFVSGDGCSSECISEFCGDGVINNTLTFLIGIGGEQCDDGNQSPGDGCAACALELIEEREPNEDGTPSTPASQPVASGNDFDGVAILNANENGALLNGNLIGALDPSGDEDVFAIKNTRAIPVFLSLRTSSSDNGIECENLDTLLVLRSEGGEVLDANDNSNGTFCSALDGVILEPDQTLYAHLLAFDDESVFLQYFLRVVTAP